MTEALPPRAVIGILGGGQLGRMLAMAAARLGLRAHIYDPAGDPPAGDVAAAVTTAAWDDVAALDAFAEAVDVITWEFENIPLPTVERLAAARPVRPGAAALAASQDRLAEKDFLNRIGLRTAPFADVPDPAALDGALAAVGLPAILKTRRMGYDGKGQARVASPGSAAPALAALSGAPAIAEGVVPFRREISVIAARGLDGSVAAYDPGENTHEDGILRRTLVPAPLSSDQRAEAVLIAGRILNALDYVGVLGVELFVTDAGMVVNEIAPRVHNSGHWTQNACAVDQFEQHIRAIAGWPIGNGERTADVEMVNLIGDDIAQTDAYARQPAAALHLYGKAETRAGRKMGHVNLIRPRSV